jgi:hypothetical protein
MSSSVLAPISPAVENADIAPECVPCAYVAIHHQWGDTLAPGRSHCRDCHRTWASLIEGHCAVCHHHFANYPAFDAHFDGDEHVDPATVLRLNGKPKLTYRTTVFGKTWRLAFYGKRPDFDKSVSAADATASSDYDPDEE